MPSHAPRPRSVPAGARARACRPAATLLIAAALLAPVGCLDTDHNGPVAPPRPDSLGVLSRAQPGDSVYATGFETELARDWEVVGEGSVRLTPDADRRARPGSYGLRIARPTGTTPGTILAVRHLDARALRGMTLTVRIALRATEVVPGPDPWNGIKVMVHATGLSSETYDQMQNLHGTFGWREVAFVARIPDNATDATLTLGLELSSGSIDLDDLRITVDAVPRRPVLDLTLARQQVPATRMPTRRGANVWSIISAEDLTVLAGWGANSIRFQLPGSYAPLAEYSPEAVAAYRASVAQALAHFDTLLPTCRSLGLSVVLDLHIPPGGIDQGGDGIFRSAEWQAEFVSTWAAMARRYATEPAVWGYDLANEPHEGVRPPGVDNWMTLAGRAARVIRAVDTTRAIIVESPMASDPRGLAFVEPLPIPGIIYSVHYYNASAFTAQGVPGMGLPLGPTYPGLINGVLFDAVQMRRDFEPVLAFQRDYGLRVLVGEFGVVRWAPPGSAVRWFSDAVQIYEGGQMDWLYHAYREWDGWSVEDVGTPEQPERSLTPTDREQFFRAAFRANQASAP